MDKKITDFCKYVPIIVFLMFLGVILGATFYYSPSWGLMDDRQNLCQIMKIWAPGFSLSNLWTLIKNDYWGCGVFRPIYYTWVAFVYYIFKEVPAVIYALIAIFNMLAALIWGTIFHSLFSRKKEEKLINVFIFPLSFFIFTPFWNIFMYISLQEKFVYFFSAVSLYFLKIGYDKNKFYPIFIATLSLFLGVLIKPTCIYLAVALCFFALLDVILLNYKKSVSHIILLIYTPLLALYYYFTVKSVRGYTSRYGDNLHLDKLINSMLVAPMIVKFLVVCATVILIFMLIRILLRKNKFDPLGILIPLGFLCYVFIFLPWGFSNYLLSAATPYVLGMFFPVFIFLNRKSEVIKYLTNILLIFIVTIVFIFIIMPRISKMSDVEKVENFIKSFNQNNPSSVYFYPPPFYESAEAMRYFTNADIIYLANSILSKDMLKNCNCNYLIFRDEGISTAILLKDARVNKEIYRNNTWRIIQLIREDGYNKEFRLDFPQSFIASFKSFVRDLK